MADRGYVNLLTHLHQSSSNLAWPTITGSIAHYLATLSPSPAPLAANTISSPLFSPVSHAKLQAFSTAFRHAVHLKFKNLKDDQGGLFARGLQTRLREWVWGVLQGFDGGVAVMRLAGTGGLLMGLEDLRSKIEMASTKARIEDEALVSLAEVMELFEQRGSGWESEFRPVTEKGELDSLYLSLIQAAQPLLLIPAEKLNALQLQTLATHLTSVVNSVFSSGSFLDSLAPSIIQNDQYKVNISAASPIQAQTVALQSSPALTSISAVSKLTARVLSVLLESRPLLGLTASSDTLAMLESLAWRVELGWIRGGLAHIEREEDIAPDSRELTTHIWTILKTLLFSTIMVTDSVLSTFVFIPPTLFLAPLVSQSPSTYTPPYSAPISSVTPTSALLALTTLQTLSHLSFVITEFGGVTSTSSSDFPELKKAFFIALDVISSDKPLSDRFAESLCKQDTLEVPEPVRQAQKAFALASIEQLVPVLNENLLPMVFNVCLPHLSDPTHRETFESAHSVVLGIFAAHAQKISEGKIEGLGEQNEDAAKTGEAGAPNGASFVEKLVPFYASCLIENSMDGRLSVPQLRLAYSALVRSASSSAHRSGAADASSLNLAQFCISALLSAIHASSEPLDDHIHRLRLTLLSTLSSIALPVFVRTLGEIGDIVKALPQGDQRTEMVENLFSEILERVGDAEKEYGMRWWHDEKKSLVGHVQGALKDSAEADGEVSVHARL